MTSVNYSDAQVSFGYFEFFNQGIQCYNDKNYLEAGKLLGKAAEITKYKTNGPDGYLAAYNAACSWSLAGKIDNAFKQLSKVDGKVFFIPHYTELLKDPDFKNLYSDPRWIVVCEKVKQTKENFEAKLNYTLVLQLDSIRKNDQLDRLKALDNEKKFGGQSTEAKDQWKIVAQKDKANLAVVENIIAKYGWPGITEVGFEGNQTIFLVIQHAELAIQKKYLPIMKEAVNHGNAMSKDYAYLMDRVALREGNKQLYGSQLVRDGKTGKMLYPAPLEDPDNVDSRREKVGLEPMSSYLKQNGITWDLESYKTMLAAKERQNVNN